MKNVTNKALFERFTFRNFRPQRSLKSMIDMKLAAFSDRIADASTIVGRVERMGIGYRCQIQGVSPQGLISGEALANDPVSAVNRLASKLLINF